MCQTMANSREDQLVAAVNDGMDPITLLVWCEQNLSPKELPTLNRLLQSDDGTLAQEIGWSLLEMILPLLREDPQEAVKCLDCIARRGNPREVVVKLAEVLERLGEDADGSEDEDESVDELPTFAGEADRIHLGTLTLDGMPALSDPKLPKADQVNQDAGKAELVDHSVSLTTLQFQSLMSMLSILHLRIKTQYPSRFLATSLPAALGAFRRIGVTALSTLAFLSFLGKLSVRKPQLPPRAPSVIGDTALTPAPEASTQNNAISTVSMPDSEPEAEGSSMQQASQNEKDIVLKLLQAVLLEAMDDYMASLQSRDPPHMSWTTRLREKAEPRRLVPGKPTELQKWHDSKPLSERDRVLQKFLAITEELRFDISEHFRNLLDENGQLPPPPQEVEDTESSSDYPTNASQVPFPPSGMLFLSAAQQYYSYPSENSAPETNNAWELICRIYRFFRSEQNTAYLHACFATEDALLSLLYLNKEKLQPTNKAFDFKLFFMSLAAFCAEFPDPQLRDAAHTIATVLFHNCADVKTKLDLVTEILKPDTASANLKAVAIGWVKDEICKPSLEASRYADQSRIQASNLESNPSILPLLFPESSSPSISRPETGHYKIPELSYYIASLNLVSVLASGKTNSQTRRAMEAVVTGLQTWRSSHEGLEDESVQNEESSQINSALDECRVGIWALDDALGRSREVLRHSTAQTSNE